MVISLRQKNILDRILWAVGGLVGFVAANTPAIVQAVPADKQALASAILAGVGVLGGDVVSDLIAFVDTGTVPTALVAQTWKDAKPIITASIAKLPTADQAVANALYAALDAKVAAVS